MSLMNLTALELGKKIRSREVSVTEAVEEALNQAASKDRPFSRRAHGRQRQPVYNGTENHLLF